MGSYVTRYPVSSRILEFVVFFYAETWGMFEGFKLAFGKEYLKVELQTYNKTILDVINKRYIRVNEGSGLFNEIKNGLNEKVGSQNLSCALRSQP